jgi:hypothetical protein
VAAGAFLLAQGLQPCDDAYITFRHARNLVRHLRPVWNLEGPPVLGSTSPAFVFLLGGLGREVPGLGMADPGIEEQEQRRIEHVHEARVGPAEQCGDECGQPEQGQPGRSS